MSWKQILEDDALMSEEFGPSQPFTIRVEGTITGETFTLESCRKGASVWNPVDLDGQLTANNPQATFGSNPRTKYRISVSAVGFNIFWNVAYPVQGG